MKSSEKAYTLYILKCSDGTYYTGIALDVEKRLIEHNNSDKGAKYTRARRPVTLMYSETCTDKSSALKRELSIKRLKRSQKEALWNCG
jgi:putative endonuclease